MTFEERLLAELKARVAERAATARAARRPYRRRLLLGVAVAAVAVAAGVTPFTGTDSPAYAISRNADGTVTVRINEFRHPERLEADLRRQGVRTDISYLRAGRTCAFGRFTSADPGYVPWDGRVEPDPKKREKALREAMNRPSSKALQADGTRVGEFTVVPRYIGPGQTLVLEVIENRPPRSGPDRRRWLWEFHSYLAAAGSPIKPCRPVADPQAFPWNDAHGHPTNDPPPGG